MISLYEMFIYSVSEWGEKTPRSKFEVIEPKDWSIMKDSNIVVRNDGIETINSDKIRADLSFSK